MAFKEVKPWDFKAQLQVGSRGEELLLERFPRKLKIHPANDGDFIQVCDGKKIELKTDTYNIKKTDNFFIERWSDVHQKKPGGPWQSYKHGCSIFIYYFVRHNTYFQFDDIPALLKKLERLTDGKGLVNIKNRSWVTGGYKVNREELKDLYNIYSW